MTSLTWDRVRGHACSYDVVDLGYNYRTTEISSAIGIVQLGKLKRNNERRNGLFVEYVNRLTNCRKLSIPFSSFRAGGRYSRHLFPVVLDETIDRQWFMNGLKERGIQTSIHYPPVHTFSYYRKVLDRVQAHGLTATEEYGRRVVTLPMHPLLKRTDAGKICDCIEELLRSWRSPCAP